jgi:hypothetical protein
MVANITDARQDFIGKPVTGPRIEPEHQPSDNARKERRRGAVFLG